MAHPNDAHFYTHTAEDFDMYPDSDSDVDSGSNRPLPVAFHPVSLQVSSPSCRPIDLFQRQSAIIERQTMAGSPRTEPIQSVRPQPYRSKPFRPWETETEHTNAEGGPSVTESIQPMQLQPLRPRPFRPWETETEHTNAEAGPSTPPPRILTVGPPTLQPSEGQSATTADAETNQTDREEDEVLVSNFCHSRIPRPSDRLFGVRVQQGHPADEGNPERLASGSGAILPNWSDGR
jgi:hypothetical protein